MFDKSSKIIDILNTVNSFDYGTIINETKYTEIDIIDWSLYRTLPVEVIENEKIGVCWDFVNYQYFQLCKSDIYSENYLFFAQTPTQNIITHTFTIAIIDNKRKWVESALWSKRGIHEVQNVIDVVKSLIEIYNVNKYELYRYNPLGLDRYLSGEEFISKIICNVPIYSK